MADILDQLSLPARDGARPRCSDCVPHRQLDQLPEPAIVARFLDVLAADPDLALGGPFSSMDDGRSLKQAGMSMFRMEFGHVHDATDGSLHLHLPPGDIRAVIESGWGEPHPTYRPAALIYAPRTEAEIETVMGIVHRSRTWMHG